MIIMNIITRHQEVAKQIIDQLLKKRLAYSVQLDEEKYNVLRDEGVIEQERNYKINFITKAMLYKQIESHIMEEAGDQDLIVYSIPVSQMNDRYSEFLRSYLVK